MTILTSCMDKYFQNDYRYVSYGNLKSDDAGWYIHSDKGNRLSIIANEASGVEFSEDLRVVASYTMESDPVDTVYNIHLHEIEEIICKDPLVPSQLTQAKIDSLGSDPANIIEAWFGGEKYLNVYFELLRYDTSLAHSVNLVFNEEESDEDNLVFEFRHNAFEDLTYYNAYGRISFDISAFVPDGETEMDVTFKWKDYYLIDRSLTGTFYLHSYSDGSFATPEFK